MRNLFKIKYGFESKYYTDNNKVKLEECEYYCKECSGKRYLDDEICINCFGCGKLDWLENIFGYKNVENIDKNIFISMELKLLEKDIKISLNQIYSQTDDMDSAEFFDTVTSLFEFYRDNCKIKSYSSSIAYFNPITYCETMKIKYMPRLNLESYINTLIPVDVELVINIY